MNRLSEDEIGKKLIQLPNWKLKDKDTIVRKFMFKSYLTGIEFVSKAGHLAEANNHHPFIEIRYKAVFISYTSWAAKGITLLDFVMAEKLEDLYKMVILANKS